MAALGIRSAINFILIAMIAIVLVRADEVDFNDPDAFADAMQEDPSLAAQASPQQLASALQKNPAVAYKLSNFDLTRAVQSDLSLLGKNEVFSEISLRTQKDPSILNQNTEIKKEWFAKFEVSDEGAQIESFDGTNVKTAGAKPTAFDVKNVKGAKVLQDGSLVVKEGATVEGTSAFSQTTDASGKKIYAMQGGVFRTVDAQPVNLKVQDGTVTVTSKIKYIRTEYLQRGLDKDHFEDVFIPEVRIQEVNYKGNFQYEKTETDHTFTSTDTPIVREYPVSKKEVIQHEITGTIIDPFNSRRGEFILGKDTSFKANDGSRLSVRGDGPVYYTEELEMPLGPNRFDPSSFCKKGVSCIINTPFRSADARSQLRFVGVDNVEKIEFSSPAYYDKVQVDDLRKGEVSFISLDKAGKEISTLSADPQQGVKMKGNVAKTFIGRFDYAFEEKGEKKITHWSSNENQKDTQYFTQNADGSPRNRNALVTCEVSACEKEFARSFGKVIAPAGKEPTVTIIVGGDNADTAKSMEPYCRQAGCYILNSRDAPPITDSQTLILTGHHAQAFGDAQWRDLPGAAPGLHKPIDALYKKDLPVGNKVQTVISSSCNSVTFLISPAEQELIRKYNPAIMIGYIGTAPAHDAFDKVPTTKDELSGFLTAYQQTTGIRSARVKKGDKYIFTTTGKDVAVPLPSAKEEDIYQNIDERVVSLPQPKEEDIYADAAPLPQTTEDIYADAAPLPQTTEDIYQ
ncbi:MAG: hypothetical protein Q7S55_02700 [Nanoarchaeota archaeon]|nr:hypothetical protein [Nanoarchaeota archaeon]